MLNLADKELAFQQQKALFVQKALSLMGIESLEDIPDITSRKPVAVQPILIGDYRRLTALEISQFVDSFFGEFGLAHFVVLNPRDRGSAPHPLLDIAEQLKDVLPLKYPVTHPMEGHAEAVARFGPSDGTLKIYDLETRDGKSGYREQAETSEKFDAHNDGLGYAGAVEAFMLYADSCPISGGYTYFQNVILLALHLAKTDPDAFGSLFLPDAITALRPRGKGAIKVSTPVCFVNEQELPQAFLRLATGEYEITWRAGSAALDRAAHFLNSHAEPFAPGSSFIHLGRLGSGCIARNHWVVHGRTAFINGSDKQDQRVLARKWFMINEKEARYKHVPGMHISRTYAQIFPERFGADLLVGDWNFDPSTGKNVRKS